MENKSYRIVEISFRYNDEYYTPYSDHYAKILNQTYHTQQNAEIALKELVQQDLYDFIAGKLWHIQDIWQMESLLTEKFGENYNKTPYPTLSLEQAYDLMVEADMVFYDIIETDINDIHYSAIWFHHEQCFFKDRYSEIYDKYTDFLIYNAHPDHIFYSFMEGNGRQIYDFICHLPNTLQGSLDDLSDSPLLLEHYIQQHEELAYNTKTQQLTIQLKHPHLYQNEKHNKGLIQMWQGLNALLKQPIFEIRYISDDE